MATNPPFPQFGVPLLPSELNSELPFSVLYGVTPSNEYIPILIDGTGALSIASVTIGGIVSANQGTPNTLANGWPVKITDGVSVLGTLSAPLRVDTTGTTVQPVSQSGVWTVQLATEPTIDIGKVDQGTPNTFANGWPVELSDGTNLLGVLTNPVRTDPTGTTTQPVSGTFWQAVQPVSGTVAISNPTLAVTQSGVWTVGRTWTLSSGADSVSAVQAGTWNINNILGTISLPTGAATEATLSLLNSKVVAVDTGNVTISTPLPAGTNVIGHVITDTGSTTIVTGNVTVVQPTGTSLHTVVDSGTINAVQSGLWTVHLAADPTIDIGEVDQGTPNSIANAWPVLITDGTNILSVTPAGEAKVSITEPLPAGTNLLGHVIIDNSPLDTGSNTYVENLAVPGGGATTTLFSYVVPGGFTYQLDGFIGWGTYDGEWLVTVNGANKGGGWSSPTNRTLPIDYEDSPIIANAGDTVAITITCYANSTQTFRLNVLADLIS